jgi:hypothetical protein
MNNVKKYKLKTFSFTLLIVVFKTNRIIQSFNGSKTTEELGKSIAHQWR